MNYFIFGVVDLLFATGLLIYFSGMPAKAAAFPKLITLVCFILTGLVSVIRGISNGDVKKLSLNSLLAPVKSLKNLFKDKQSLGVIGLLVATFLYVLGTDLIGFFPTTFIYFAVVLLLIYKKSIKGTVVYTACTMAFLYVFFVLIFNVKI